MFVCSPPARLVAAPHFAEMPTERDRPHQRPLPTSRLVEHAGLRSEEVHPNLPDSPHAAQGGHDLAPSLFSEHAVESQHGRLQLVLHSAPSFVLCQPDARRALRGDHPEHPTASPSASLPPPWTRGVHTHAPSVIIFAHRPVRHHAETSPIHATHAATRLRCSRVFHTLVFVRHESSSAALEKESDMKLSARDILILVTGIAAHESIGHWWLGIWGREMLPIKLGRITFTAEWNTFAMIAWPIALVPLVYFGWWRRAPARPGASPGQPKVLT